MKKAQVGWVLMGVAAALVAVALFLWQDGTLDADADQLAEEYRGAISGTEGEDVSADRALPLALGGLAAVLFLGGVVLVAVPDRELVDRS